jgi:hypothetical protein
MVANCTPGVGVAQRGQPIGECVECGPVGHADGEEVESAESSRALGVQPQSQLGAAVGVAQRQAHQDAVLDELHL